MKLPRPLRFQYVTISKAFINTFTVIAMVHHDSPQFELHSKLGEDLDVKKKIQHHYMAIDFDLTNTAKPGLTGIKEENIAPIRFK